MTELIVRELRLRAFEGLTQAGQRRQDARAKAVVDITDATTAREGDRLAARYSRRRAQPGDLAL